MTSLPPTYIPAEVAVARVSLVGGVEEVVQAFLAPGEVPPGFAHRCRQAAGRLHQIPLDGRDMPPLRGQWLAEPFRRTADDEVCRRLDALLNGATLLLSLPGMEVQDEAVLRLVYTRAGRPCPALHQAPLALLLAALHPALSPAMAEVALQRERFLYSPVSCAWHHTRTDSLHCTEAVVRRAGYSMLAILCPLFHLPLLPASHLPPEPWGEVGEVQEWREEGGVVGCGGASTRGRRRGKGRGRMVLTEEVKERWRNREDARGATSLSFTTLPKTTEV